MHVIFKFSSILEILIFIKVTFSRIYFQWLMVRVFNISTHFFKQGGLSQVDTSLRYQ